MPREKALLVTQAPKRQDSEVFQIHSSLSPIFFNSMLYPDGLISQDSPSDGASKLVPNEEDLPQAERCSHWTDDFNLETDDATAAKKSKKPKYQHPLVSRLGANLMPLTSLQQVITESMLIYGEPLHFEKIFSFVSKKWTSVKGKPGTAFNDPRRSVAHALVTPHTVYKLFKRDGGSDSEHWCLNRKSSRVKPTAGSYPTGVVDTSKPSDKRSKSLERAELDKKSEEGRKRLDRVQIYQALIERRISEVTHRKNRDVEISKRIPGLTDLQTVISEYLLKHQGVADFSAIVKHVEGEFSNLRRRDGTSYHMQPSEAVIQALTNVESTKPLFTRYPHQDNVWQIGQIRPLEEMFVKKKATPGFSGGRRLIAESEASRARTKSDHRGESSAAGRDGGRHAVGAAAGAAADDGGESRSAVNQRRLPSTASAVLAADLTDLHLAIMQAMIAKTDPNEEEPAVHLDDICEHVLDHWKPAPTNTRGTPALKRTVLSTLHGCVRKKWFERDMQMYSFTNSGIRTIEKATGQTVAGLRELFARGRWLLRRPAEKPTRAARSRSGRDSKEPKETGAVAVKDKKAAETTKKSSGKADSNSKDTSAMSVTATTTATTDTAKESSSAIPNSLMHSYMGLDDDGNPLYELTSLALTHPIERLHERAIAAGFLSRDVPNDIQAIVGSLISDSPDGNISMDQTVTSIEPVLAAGRLLKRDASAYEGEARKLVKAAVVAASPSFFTIGGDGLSISLTDTSSFKQKMITYIAAKAKLKQPLCDIINADKWNNNNNNNHANIENEAKEERKLTGNKRTREEREETTKTTVDSSLDSLTSGNGAHDMISVSLTDNPSINNNNTNTNTTNINSNLQEKQKAEADDDAPSTKKQKTT